MNRTKRIEFRVSLIEYESLVLSAQEEGLTLSDFIRRGVLYESGLDKNEIRLTRKARNQLGREVRKLNSTLKKMAGSIEALTKKIIDNPTLEQEDKRKVETFKSYYMVTRAVVENFKKDYKNGFY
jgi:hypothetical protein